MALDHPRMWFGLVEAHRRERRARMTPMQRFAEDLPEYIAIVVALAVLVPLLALLALLAIAGLAAEAVGDALRLALQDDAKGGGA